MPRPFYILRWRLHRLQSNELVVFLLFSRLHRVCRALEKRDEFRDYFQSPLAAIDEISQITLINDQSAAAFLLRNVPKTRSAQRTFQTSHRASHLNRMQFIESFVLSNAGDPLDQTQKNKIKR